MNPNRKLRPVDQGLFEVNRSMVDPEMLVPYLGKHIAWSGDATWIVASADTIDDLFDQLDEMGIPVGYVVHDFVG